MTLASILLFSAFWTTSNPAPNAIILPCTNTHETQGQEAPKPAPAATQASPNSPAAPSAPHQETTSKRPKHKKIPASDCSTYSPGTPGSTPSDPAAPQQQTSGSTNPQKNCPPPKIVVKQGGTSEPSIQLAGEAGGAQSGDTAKMLDAAQQNLKKLADRQMSAEEQDTVLQIRQFMDQSKAASAAGDTKRANTLAWKAQTLSDDIVNPKK